jgi:hypothetical protein
LDYKKHPFKNENGGNNNTGMVGIAPGQILDRGMDSFKEYDIKKNWHP